MLKEVHSVEDIFYGTATVGDRGQIVIPSEARKELDINPGDKLLVVRHLAAYALGICKIGAMSKVIESMLEDVKQLESKAASEHETL
ncbi:AbrB/MazE/SpoVT family DNA-binding domain-containing protein [bacterium]|nr:AbrB/MazE/SpoVT family DNA-binding domain-containing protein [bacterium]